MRLVIFSFGLDGMGFRNLENRKFLEFQEFSRVLFEFPEFRELPTSMTKITPHHEWRPPHDTEKWLMLKEKRGGGWGGLYLSKDAPLQGPSNWVRDT